MEKIYSSASKIVFIILTVSLVYLTIVKIVDPKDFMTLCAMAFTYYFSNKPNDSSGTLVK